MSNIQRNNELQQLLMKHQALDAQRKGELDNQTGLRYGNIAPYSTNSISGFASLMLDKTEAFPHKVFASCAPTRLMFTRFWTTIFEQDISTILMLTKYYEESPSGTICVKADRYLPEDGNNVSHGEGEISVTCSSSCEEEIDGDLITIKTITLVQRGETKTVKHVHCTTWPDRSAVAVRFLSQLISLILRTQEEGALLVHCSAGVGRTGTFIAALISTLNIEGLATTEQIFPYLRERRVCSVQSLAQLILVDDFIKSHQQESDLN